MTNKDKPKKAGKKERPRPLEGQVFAVPLSDGSFALAQVAFVKWFPPNTSFVTSAFFETRASTPELLREILRGSDLSKPISVFTLSDSPIEAGEWILLEERPVTYDNVDVQSRIKGDWGWFDRKQRPWSFFLESYHGLFPWDGFYKPNYIDEYLLPPYQRPASARTKKDFPPEFLQRHRVKPA
jgi:hypothetical protein